MGLQTFESVAMIESHEHGMRIETYSSPLALVLSLMNHGSIGGGGYGDKKHEAALIQVEKQLARVRRSIARQKSDDARTARTTDES